MSTSVPSSSIIYGIFRSRRIAEKSVDVKLLREMSESEWEKVRSAHDVVFQATHSFDKFLEFSWVDLQESEDTLFTEIDRNQADAGRAMTDFQYRLLNFSVGLKLYHERILAEANRRCTVKQKELVNRAFSRLYGSNFGYRLVYSMRNAYLHGVRNLVNMRSSTRLVQGPKENVVTELKVELRKEAFSNSRTNAAVRREVQELSEIADLRQLCVEAYVGVSELHPQIMDIMLPDASIAAQLIWSYMQEVEGEQLQFLKLDPELLGNKNQDIDVVTLDQAGFNFVIDRCAPTSRKADHRKL